MPPISESVDKNSGLNWWLTIKDIENHFQYNFVEYEMTFCRTRMRTALERLLTSRRLFSHNPLRGAGEQVGQGGSTHGHGV
jgi:hypothetical protein